MARALPTLAFLLALSVATVICGGGTTPTASRRQPFPSCLSSWGNAAATVPIVASAAAERPRRSQMQQRAQGGMHYEHRAISLSRSKISRWKQRCRHRRLTRRVPTVKAKIDSAGWRGTCLRISFGCGRERVVEGGACAAGIAELFGSDRHSTHHPAPFNHNMVGMTNPCLHIGVRDRTTLRAVIPASSSSSAAPPTGDFGEGRGDADQRTSLWWPGTAFLSDGATSDGSSSSSSSSSDYPGWKVLRLRRRVGWSPSCYQAVRDAALNWEFDGDGEAGIAAVSSLATRRRRTRRRGDATLETGNAGYSVAPGYSRVDASECDVSAPFAREVAQEEDFDAFHPTQSDQVQQIWSGPGSRRLVTYTALPSKGPVRVVAMNPVGVVYDLVDQRGLDGSTTYTSTAYATLRGHWLTGEERVTVALRDSGSVDVEILSYSRPSRSWPGRVVWPFVGGMQRRFFERQLDALERAAAQAAIAAPRGPMPAVQ
jgi:uncharacterized protein (UPF0548 family)